MTNVKIDTDHKENCLYLKNIFYDLQKNVTFDLMIKFQNLLCYRRKLFIVSFNYKNNLR